MIKLTCLENKVWISVFSHGLWLVSDKTSWSSPPWSLAEVLHPQQSTTSLAHWGLKGMLDKDRHTLDSCHQNTKNQVWSISSVANK